MSVNDDIKIVDARIRDLKEELLILKRLIIINVIEPLSKDISFIYTRANKNDGGFTFFEVVFDDNYSPLCFTSIKPSSMIIPDKKKEFVCIGYIVTRDYQIQGNVIRVFKWFSGFGSARLPQEDLLDYLKDLRKKLTSRL